MVNVSCSLLGTTLLSLSFRSDARWRPIRRRALALLSAQALAFVLQVVTLAAHSNWGLANRFFVVTAVSWFFAVAFRLREIARARTA